MRTSVAAASGGGALSFDPCDAAAGVVVVVVAVDAAAVAVAAVAAKMEGMDGGHTARIHIAERLPDWARQQILAGLLARYCYSQE